MLRRLILSKQKRAVQGASDVRTVKPAPINVKVVRDTAPAHRKRNKSQLRDGNVKRHSVSFFALLCENSVFSLLFVIFYRIM